MEVLGLAMAWAQANCPDDAVLIDLLRWVEQSVRRNNTCMFLIGKGLIRSGQPFLLAIYRGEFFAFQLTPRQASQMGIKDEMLVSSRCGVTSTAPHTRASYRCSSSSGLTLKLTIPRTVCLSSLAAASRSDCRAGRRLSIRRTRGRRSIRADR